MADGSMDQSQIDKARECKVVDDLYKQIDATTPIEIVFVNGWVWSSSTKGGKTKIEVGKGENPAAALMHELLHAKIKIAGFSGYNISTFNSDIGRRAQPIIDALDNELQHHVMYPDFLAAGFRGEHFYNDEDDKSFKRIRREVEKMNSKSDVAEFFLNYLTLMAPGGQGTDQERTTLKNYLFRRCGEVNRHILESIERDVADWSSNPITDHGNLLRGILTKLGVSGIWVGRSTNFPSDGFFAGDEFSIISAQAYMLTK